MDISQDPRYDIRYSEEADQAFLQKLLQQPAAYSESSYANEEERVLIEKMWVSYIPYMASLTAFFEGNRVGMALVQLMPYGKTIHQAMCMVLVDPTFQRRGIGSSLLKNALHLAKTRFRIESISAEVYGERIAYRFLEKNGFRKVFRQEEFFHVDGTFLPRIVMEKRPI